MDKPAVTVVPDQPILAAAAADPAIMRALEAGSAAASAAARGCSLIDAIPAGGLEAWDGRDELALVGPSA